MKKTLFTIILAVAMALTLPVFFGNSTSHAASNPYNPNATDANGNWANCTYWAWQLAKDNTGVELPKWGNAGTWYASAQAAGYATGTTPRAGSLIVYSTGTYGHVGYVSDYNSASNQIYIKEGGHRGTSNGYYEGWISLQNSYNGAVTGFIYLANHNPVVWLDSVTSNSAGKVTYKGWAFDPDNTSASVTVHLYAWIGDQAYSFKAITANKSRPDVNNVYGCGNNHGFEATACATVSGKVNANVAVLNIGEGDTTWSNAITMTIKKDSTKPTISNIAVTNLTSTGYTVTCDVSDNAGIKEVSFPTWTESNDQDDIVWYKGTVKSGKVTCKIKTSNHSWQSKCKYCTDIYAGDYMGNVAVVNTSDIAPRVKVPSPISNVKFTDVNASGYTITCDVDPAWPATSIKFPTWTDKNAQDDLIWHEGTLSNGKGTYRVLAKDHGNAKCESYITHIYVYNSQGYSNCAAAGVRNHTMKKIAAKAATTSAAGNIAYWKCSVCGKCFKDSAGNTEITKKSTIIPKLIAKPKATSITKLTKAKKAFTVKWKKRTKNTKGYQIMYSTSKSFKSGKKTVTIKKNTITSKKIKKLKAKKTYYVKIRTYRVVNGKKYCSAWSKVKSVKTK